MTLKHLPPLAAALALGACSTIDWRGVGEDFVRNTCDDAGNCEYVCPDGTPTDPDFPRCPDPTFERGGR